MSVPTEASLAAEIMQGIQSLADAGIGVAEVRMSIAPLAPPEPAPPDNLVDLSKEELIALVRTNSVIPVTFPPPRCPECGPNGESVAWDYVNHDWALLCAMCESLTLGLTEWKGGL